VSFLSRGDVDFFVTRFAQRAARKNSISGLTFALISFGSFGGMFRIFLTQIYETKRERASWYRKKERKFRLSGWRLRWISVIVFCWCFSLLFFFKFCTLMCWLCGVLFDVITSRWTGLPPAWWFFRAGLILLLCCTGWWPLTACNFERFLLNLLFPRKIIIKCFT